MTVGKATRKYEAWLGKHARLIVADLVHKHEAMAENAFSFFRATFYRWAQHWPVVCPRLAAGPRVLAVGDLHVENFGTWRDAEGRLAWGINDFDEAFPAACTIDLVRLASSALLAIHEGHLALAPETASEAILEGYRESLAERGRPFVIDETHRWFAPLIEQQARDRAHFWQKLRDLPPLESEPPRSALKALRTMLPDGLPMQLAHRIAGLGSLGKPRYVALAEWHGGPIAREAKSLTPSAFAWADGERKPQNYYPKILDNAMRCPDPMFGVRGRWVVRRLSPECQRVELITLPKPHDDARLLHAMGWETANVHNPDGGRRKTVAAEMKRRGAWLHKNASAMLEVTLKDWRQWKEEFKGGSAPL